VSRLLQHQAIAQPTIASAAVLGSGTAATRNPQATLSLVGALWTRVDDNRSLESPLKAPPRKPRKASFIADYPQEAEYRHALANSHTELSTRWASRRRFDEAEEQAARAIAVLDRENPADRASLARAEFRLGRALRARGDHHAACEQFSKAAALQRSVPDGSSITLSWFLYYYGEALERIGQNEDAAAVFSEMLSLRLKEAAKPHDVSVSYLRLGAVQEKLGQLDEAESSYREALARFQSESPDEHPDGNKALDALIGLLRHQARHQAAEEVLAVHRERRAQRFGVVFGSEWSIAVHDMAEPNDADDERLLVESIRGAARNTFTVAALDFRCPSDAPHPDLPANRFALVAESELRLDNNRRYEICLEAPLAARVLVDNRVVLVAPTDCTLKYCRAEIALDPAPQRIRVEILQRHPATRLRMWLRPLDGP
jgi:tetratricopeptide (TPR) repeat protein